MSGRYLVIEFDNEAQAESLRAKIDNAKSPKFRIVGMFARPDNLCKCFREVKNAKQWGIKRGAKYGWWMCPDCRKGLLRDHQLENLIEPKQIKGVGSFKARGPNTTSYPLNSVEGIYRYLVPALHIIAVPFKGKIDSVTEK